MDYKQKQRESEMAWKRSRAGYKPEFMKDNGNLFAVMPSGTIYYVTNAGWLYVGKATDEKLPE